MRFFSDFILYVRALAFLITFYGLTLVLFIVMMPTLFMTRRQALLFPQMWTRLMDALIGFFCGIRTRVEGLENLPAAGGYIIASKHQSAMETTLFHRIVPNIFYVFKRELLLIPLAGFYMLKTGCVPIDRGGGAKTLRRMLVRVQQRLRQGMNLVIFPEGTRTRPGTKKPYAPGIAFLYDNCGVPVVPVALNTGYVWPKNKVAKYPGTVTVRFLPPIPPGLHKRAFLAELYDRIEEAQDTLPPPFGKTA